MFKTIINFYSSSTDLASRITDDVANFVSNTSTRISIAREVSSDNHSVTITQEWLNKESYIDFVDSPKAIKSLGWLNTQIGKIADIKITKKFVDSSKSNS